MLIYIPKLSDANQLIKIDQLFSSHNNTSTSIISSNTGNVNDKRQNNNSNSLALGDDEESHNQESNKSYMNKRHKHRYAQNDELALFDEENNIGSSKNIHHVHFDNDEHDYAEEVHYEKKNTNKKCDSQQYNNNVVEPNSSHGNNDKPKNIDMHYEDNDHYTIPDESNSSDSFHYKVPHESSKSVLYSNCSSSVRYNNNNNNKNSNNPKSVHSGISTLTDDFGHNKWKTKIQQHANDINNINLSISHVTAQDTLNHDVDTNVRQMPSSSNEAARDAIAGVGETIFVIGDTMVI